MASEKKGSKIPLKLLNGKILVKIEEEGPRVTKSGLYLSDTANPNETQKKGIVVKLGMERQTEDGTKIPFVVAENDNILFSRPYSAELIEWDDEKYLLLSESDVIAIIEK